MHAFRGRDVRGGVDRHANDSEEGSDDEDDALENKAVEAREMQQERAKWGAIRKAQIERSHDHEGFFAELEQSSSG